MAHIKLPEGLPGPSSLTPAERELIATWTPEGPAIYKQTGEMLATTGYVRSIR